MGADGSNTKQRRPAFVGIDVACAKGKRLPVSVCIRHEGARLEMLPLRSTFDKPPSGRGNVEALEEQQRVAFAEEVLSWLRSLETAFDLSIERVGIDAPSDFCRDVSGRRAAERCLDAKGISCFATPSESEFVRKIEHCRRYLASGGAPAGLPNANQIWMLVGFQLFRTLSHHFECIETYPQAIIRQLACDSGHKSTAAGLQCQLEEAAEILRISPAECRKKLDEAVYGSPHDRLDAFFTAWVASLADHERVGFGSPPGDVIWAPLARAERSA